MTIEAVDAQGYVSRLSGRVVRGRADKQAYKAEFFDTRMAAKAIQRLNGVPAAGGKLKVLYDIAASETPYTLGSAAYRPSLLASPTAGSSQRSPTEVSDADVFGPITRYTVQRPISEAQQQPYTPATPTSTFRKHHSQPLTSSPMAQQEDTYRGQSLPTTPLHLMAMGRRFSEPGMLAGLASQADISARVRIGQGLGGVPRSPSQAIPEQNRVFPERVAKRQSSTLYSHTITVYSVLRQCADSELDLDMRTSVMVKDVPVSLDCAECCLSIEQAISTRSCRYSE